MRDFLIQLVVDLTRKILAVVLIVSVVVAIIAWGLSGIDTRVRYGAPAAAAVALIGLVFVVRRDRLPDFLAEVTESYFERGGFCFALEPAANDGVCWIGIYFQNKYERPCRARLKIRPSTSFLLDKPRIPTLEVSIECGPAAFGVTHVPLAVPQEYQGTKQKFDLTATVEYPGGRGRTLRFGEGRRVSDQMAVGGAAYAASILLGLLTPFHVRVPQPGHVTMELPRHVADTLPDGTELAQEVFWQLGDALPTSDTNINPSWRKNLSPSSDD